MDAQFPDICKMLVKHFEAAEIFISGTKYFTSTQIQATLYQAALQQTSIEDIAEQQRKRKMKQVRPLKRHAIIVHFEYFSPYEFGEYISSLFHDAVRSSL